MLKAPFPYFGGKSAIADKVWSALGDVSHYIEPFFGSGAVLLGRPTYHKRRLESVNDKDGFICNVWRALQYNPDEVAKWCDWPVNHAELAARKMELINNEEMLLENLVNDVNFYDPKLAGFWVWSASCWIGSGLTRCKQIPEIARSGCGVHKSSLADEYKEGQIPMLGHTGKGVHKSSLNTKYETGQIPHISDTGLGVHKSGIKMKIPSILKEEIDSNVQNPYKPGIFEWFRELSERLRNVRVVCGDWTRITGGKWQDDSGLCGVFFDPPYSDEAKRTDNIYHKDSESAAKEVAKWAQKRGSNINYRIVLTGYIEEHEWLIQEGWSVERWTAQGGYANKGDGPAKTNRKREALFYSPHCIQNQPELF